MPERVKKAPEITHRYKLQSSIFPCFCRIRDRAVRTARAGYWGYPFEKNATLELFDCQFLTKALISGTDVLSSQHKG